MKLYCLFVLVNIETPSVRVYLRFPMLITEAGVTYHIECPVCGGVTLDIGPNQLLSMSLTDAVLDAAEDERINVWPRRRN